MPIVPRNGKVAVVGAGISGLCYSYFLRKLRPDVHISIFERALEPGGWIKTLQMNDNGDVIRLELGPRTLRGVSDGALLIVDIMRQLKLEHEVEVMKSTSIANRKWLLDGSSKLVQVPNSIALLAKFITSDVTDGALLGAISEPFREPAKDSGDESIESFVLRRFGSPMLANNIISAIMHGIYSGDVAQLSVRSTLPSLVDFEQRHGSIIKAALFKMLSRKPTKELDDRLKEYELLISPGAQLEDMATELKKFPILRLKSGLQTFPKALVNYLNQDEKVDLHFDADVKKIGLKDCTFTLSDQGDKEMKFDRIRFNAGLKSFQEVVKIDNQEVKQAVNSVLYSTIFLANVYIKNRKLIPQDLEGFGFLVPKTNKNPQSLLGVIYDSCTEAHTQNFFNGGSREQAPYTKLTIMMGGHYFNERGIPSSKVNIRAIKSVLKDIIGIDVDQFNVVLRDEANIDTKNIALGENDMLISYHIHRDCIPLYNVGFSEIVSTILHWVDQETNGRVTLGGPSMGRLGIPDCVVAELQAALNFK